MTERTIPLYPRSVLKIGSSFFTGIINAVGGIIATMIEVTGNEIVTGTSINNGNLVVCGNVTINGDIDIGGAINVAGSTITPMPSGSIMPYCGGTGTPAPEWLVCDGASYSTATYSDLFGVIGYTYGGAGANFNVPDLRGRVTIGQDLGAGVMTFAPNTLGSAGGSESVILSPNQLPAHNHLTVPGAEQTTPGEGAHSHSFSGSAVTPVEGSHTNTATGTGGSHQHNVNYTTQEGRDYAGGGESFNVETLLFENVFFSNTQFMGGGGPYPTGGHISGGGGHSHAFTVTPGVTSAEMGHGHAPVVSTIAGTDTGHTNVQPYIVINYVIKT